MTHMCTNACVCTLYPSTSPLVQLIDSLQRQRSRHEALCLLLEIELASHHHTHNLLAALGATLGEWDSACRERTVSVETVLCCLLFIIVFVCVCVLD